MSNKLYAIIDIETTGGTAAREKITEIAVVLHDGQKIVDSYETLLNPERSIPYYITQLTGISDDMVQDAPKFYEVAKHIVKMTEGAIFVAHNVRFDYSFVQEEFRRLGFTYVRKQLCTVRLARKAFPGLGSYSLANLIKHFKIKVTDRHRAMADAAATVVLFEKILAKEGSVEEAATMINQGIKESQLPNNIPLESLHQLPQTCGIYYFYDKNGEVIYVGKSINIQKRIFEHFGDKTTKGDKLQKGVFSFSFEETGSELVALLLEDYEIKRLKPAINRAQRRTYFPYGVYNFTDDKGYLRFNAVKNVAEIRKRYTILQEFEKLSDAKNYLKSVVKRYDLCEKLIGTPYNTEKEKITEGSCFHHQIGQCRGACVGEESPVDYNERALIALERMTTIFEEDFFIFDKGKSPEEQAVILIQDGKYQGFGYVDAQSSDVEDLFSAIKKYPNQSDTHRIISSHLRQNKKVRIMKLE